MGGVYFHIPFCRQKCNYCDFYSIRDSKGVDDLIRSEIKELFLRKNYLEDRSVNTIYFGGGTPSLLTVNQIEKLVKGVKDNFSIAFDCEITLEANPDDLTEEYLLQLHDLGINRLSVGIQSFNDEILKFLGRRHDSSRLVSIIESAQKVGFSNISVDLIFAIPGMNPDSYQYSLEKVIKLDIQHVSAYSLTIEKGTQFYKMLLHNKIQEVIEDDMLMQFNNTIDYLGKNGFSHYEISNYAKDGFKSRHNCSYWENVSYLGIGPSAHSYNGGSRQWNVSNTKRYCEGILKSEAFFQVEYLTPNDKYNEYVMTGLRTSKGVFISYIKDNFHDSVVHYFCKEVNQLLSSDLIYKDGDRVVLTRKGILISDYIVRKLYFV